MTDGPSSSNPLELDATGQAAAISRGELSPAELIEASIARAEAVNPALNAIIHEFYDEARGEAGETTKAAAPPAIPHTQFESGRST